MRSTEITVRVTSDDGDSREVRLKVTWNTDPSGKPHFEKTLVSSDATPEAQELILKGAGLSIQGVLEEGLCHQALPYASQN